MCIVYIKSIFGFRNWKIELAIACKNNHKPSLLKVLIKMFGAKYLFYGFILAIDEIILK